MMSRKHHHVMVYDLMSTLKPRNEVFIAKMFIFRQATRAKILAALRLLIFNPLKKKKTGNLYQMLKRF